jgi:hypothetical protein
VGSCSIASLLPTESAIISGKFPNSSIRRCTRLLFGNCRYKLSGPRRSSRQRIRKPWAVPCRSRPGRGNSGKTGLMIIGRCRAML